MDRFDAKYIKDLDSMHFIMPFLFPNRCDNEVFFTFKIDLTNLNKYIEEKNSHNPEYKYNMFQCIVAATLKTIILRSKLSIFIHNKKMYKRNDITAAFTVKQEFTDEGEEVLAYIKAEKDWTIKNLHDVLHKKLLKLRDKSFRDESSDIMDTFNKLPKFISRPILNLITFLERKGLVPKSLVETDPYHSSVYFANLGSIGLPSGFHHLTNWGTTSMFMVIGKREKMPFYENDKTVFKEGVELSLTIDERIADGYYFSKSIKLLKYFLENPELLDKPFNERLDDEIFKNL